MPTSSHSERSAHISWSLFVDAYRKALGVEKATTLLDETLSDVGLSRSSSYDGRQAKQIIDHLKEKGGIVKIIATTISTRLIVSGSLE